MAASASAQHVLVDEDGCQDAANAAKTLSDGEVSRAVLRRKNRSRSHRREAGWHPVFRPLSIFRIVFGLLFTLHGTMKLFGWPVGEAVPVATWPFWWAGLIELITGVLITVGFFTRIAALVATG